jgi:peptidoglycan/xylan/chitin deacetylase (PgdA/CDA1 family)
MILRAAYHRGKTSAKHALLRACAAVHTLRRQGGREVLLTFDDGPHPEVTAGVLDRLKLFGARAAFFVVGNRIPRAPHLLRRALAEGHLIGNHSFAHHLDRPPWLVPYVKDLARCQRAIEAITGQRPRLFRPPLGRISVASLLAPRCLGLRAVYWSVDPRDWRLRDPGEARACGERLTAAVSPGDIILLHDDNPCVLSVLDALLPSLVSQGYDLTSAVHNLQAAHRTG